MPVYVIKNDFRKIAAELKIAAKAEEAHAAENIAAEARSHAPVQTGRLKASIQAKGNEVYTNVDYSRFVEYGTRYMGAEPFFFRAVERERPHIVGALTAFFRRFG
jgi:HK97 gp10 family phage protein